MTTLLATGDSNTKGNVPGSGTVYVQKIANTLGLGLLNNSVSGTRAMDQSYASQGFGSGDLITHMIGTNDSDAYGNSSTKLAKYKLFLRSIILNTSGYNLVNGASQVTTGTWGGANNVGSTTYGIYSTGAATTTATVYGTVVYVACIHALDSSFDGTFTITIDGVLKDTITLSGSTDGVDGAVSHYGSEAFRYPGLTDGAHSVVISTTGTGGKSYGSQFIMGNGHQPFKRPILVFDILPKLAYNSPDSATNNAAYSTAIQSVVSELKSDGFNIGFVTASTSLVSTDYVDNLHLNDSGHTKLANAGLTVLYGLSTGTTTSTTVYPTGSFSIPCGHITGTWDGAGGIILPVHITT